MNDEISGKEVYAVVRPSPSGRTGTSGQRMDCLQVNRKGDEIAQMATEYSALEIAYFKAVVRSIEMFLFPTRPTSDTLDRTNHARAE